MHTGEGEPSGQCPRDGELQRWLSTGRCHPLVKPAEWEGPVPSTGGLGELQNSGNFSLSIARSSLSNLGLSNRGAKCLGGGGRNEGGHQSPSVRAQQRYRNGSEPHRYTWPHTDCRIGAPGDREAFEALYNAVTGRAVL